ncbi:ribosomal-protein-alanine N-acetyltransferase [Devosia pacifica]|uniref:Ribosomal-protein-alanine N-acetyltransferase n=1 Tax=Devosia pacifica TaxID=1335967 RepID=A0A918SA20_9HYPH|nr:GNAT family protein [Devosia pacifica]GHA30558.1 ribosomal-protein-alanine N-acetyltransferase [Devosia pacifica]
MFWPWTSSETPVLEGTTVHLRLPQLRDYDQWYALRRSSRDFLRPFEPRWTELDLARSAFVSRVRRGRQEAVEGTDYSFFVLRMNNGAEELLGGITLSNVRRRAAQHVNLGYWMGQPFAGQGIMTEAVGATLPFIFDTLSLHRAHAAFLPHNMASRRVLEKNGFVEEGFAEAYLQIDGRWADHVLFGLTRERFESRRYRNDWRV